MMRNQILKPNGFTLMEILISLFIFTIVSLILTTALHNVMGSQSSTEDHAERLRKLQLTMLLLERDIEQAVDRPVLNATGKQEEAFIGSPLSFTFTHLGFANPTGTVTRSSLQRTKYTWDRNILWRGNWEALDQAPRSEVKARPLDDEIIEARFRYLDKNKRFHDNWPLTAGGKQPLPRAVEIELTISKWGKLKQLYVISANVPEKPPERPRTN